MGLLHNHNRIVEVSCLFQKSLGHTLGVVDNKLVVRKLEVIYFVCHVPLQVVYRVRPRANQTTLQEHYYAIKLWVLYGVLKRRTKSSKCLACAHIVEKLDTLHIRSIYRRKLITKI